jgi:hypothetical protein
VRSKQAVTVASGHKLQYNQKAFSHFLPPHQAFDRRMPIKTIFL